MHLLRSPGALEEALETSHADRFSYTSFRLSSADHSIINYPSNTIRGANSIVLFCRNLIEIDHEAGIELRRRRRARLLDEEFRRILASSCSRSEEDVILRRNKERGKEGGKFTRDVRSRTVSFAARSPTNERNSRRDAGASRSSTSACHTHSASTRKGAATFGLKRPSSHHCMKRSIVKDLKSKIKKNLKSKFKICPNSTKSKIVT